jgi:HEAT repeat protein
MKKRYTLSLVAILIATFAFSTLATACWGQYADASREKELELIAILESDVPPADKAVPCKLLAVYGSKDAVPALAALLDDPDLASWALIALEAIPAPEAGVALRDALGDLDGLLLVGVINTLAVRQDAEAVDPLISLLGNVDTEIANSAAAALGRIGGDAATQALLDALNGNLEDRTATVAEGCIYCAEHLLAAGETDKAVLVYEAVRAANITTQRNVEAIRGLILAQGEAGVPLLIEQLQSEDKIFFRLGMTVAREATATGVTEAIVWLMAGATPDRQVLFLYTLADRGDAAALPAVLQAAQSEVGDVRNAAVEVLTQLGDVSTVGTLLDIALESDEQTSATVVTALQDMPGQDVDADLVARLSQVEGEMRQLVITIAGRRRIAAATDELLVAVAEADAGIRSAALAALGETIDAEQLDVLIDCVLNPRSEEDFADAHKALLTACIRMPDGEACAMQLARSLEGTSTSTQCAVLEILGAMGNSTALIVLEQAGKQQSTELQDTATRLLGEWMTVDAAPVLLDLAETAPETSYQIRAMRGYIRLVRQFVIPNDERVVMCRAALETAQRDAERLLVLEVMERYPSVEMLRLAIEAADTPSLKNEATRVALAIAQSITGSSEEVRELLELIGQEPIQVEIIKAEYGAEGTLKDVTEILQGLAGMTPLITLPASTYNASFGGDPVPSVPKKLTITYKIDGKSGEAVFAENATIVLPIPE